MFDDPKKELKRLQEQLLAAEEAQWEQEPLDTEEFSGRFLQEEPDMLQEKAPEEEEEVAAPRNNHIPALVAALLLEVAALCGVLAWWLLWR